MQNKYLWIALVVIITIFVCGSLWIMFKPQQQQQTTVVQPVVAIQDILMEHIEYLPEVYRAHENYAGQLQNDSCILIYRYSSGMCVSCYQYDLMDLRGFIKSVGRNSVLVLPAYPSNDHRNRMRMNSETGGLNYRNIPADSLALPIHEYEGEMRYFAVIDSKGHVEMVYFPHDGCSELTQAYLKKVERRIRKQ